MKLSYYDTQRRAKKRKVVCEERSFYADGGEARHFITDWETDSEVDQGGSSSSSKRRCLADDTHDIPPFPQYVDN